MFSLRLLAVIGFAAGLCVSGSQGGTLPTTKPEAAKPGTNAPNSTIAARTKPSSTLVANPRVNAAKAGGVANSNHLHNVHGVVEHVHHVGKDKKHHGTFVVRVHHAATKNKPAHHSEVKFHVNENTRFDFFHGKDHKPAHFSNLHKGEHVIVHHHADHPHLATKVDIHVGKKTVTATIK